MVAVCPSLQSLTFEDRSVSICSMASLECGCGPSQWEEVDMLSRQVRAGVPALPRRPPRGSRAPAPAGLGIVGAASHCVLSGGLALCLCLSLLPGSQWLGPELVPLCAGHPRASPRGLPTCDLEAPHPCDDRLVTDELNWIIHYGWDGIEIAKGNFPSHISRSDESISCVAPVYLGMQIEFGDSQR